MNKKSVVLIVIVGLALLAAAKLVLSHAQPGAAPAASQAAAKAVTDAVPDATYCRVVKCK